MTGSSVLLRAENALGATAPLDSAALHCAPQCALLAGSVWVDCRLGEYSLHDLVVLDQQTVGVIISIGSDSCQVLTNKNQVRKSGQVGGGLPALMASQISQASAASLDKNLHVPLLCFVWHCSGLCGCPPS